VLTCWVLTVLLELLTAWVPPVTVPPYAEPEVTPEFLRDDMPVAGSEPPLHLVERVLGLSLLP